MSLPPLLNQGGRFFDCVMTVVLKAVRQSKEVLRPVDTAPQPTETSTDPSPRASGRWG